MSMTPPCGESTDFPLEGHRTRERREPISRREEMRDSHAETKSSANTAPPVTQPRTLTLMGSTLCSSGSGAASHRRTTDGGSKAKTGGKKKLSPLMNSELTAQLYERTGAPTRLIGSNWKMRDERTWRRTPGWCGGLLAGWKMRR